MPAIKVLTALDQARTHYYHFKAGHRTSSSTWVSLHQPIRSLPHAPVMNLIGRVYYSTTTTPATAAGQAHAAGRGLRHRGRGAAWSGTSRSARGDRVGRRRVCTGPACYSWCAAPSAERFLRVPHTRLRPCQPLLPPRRGLPALGHPTIMSEFANKRTRGAFIAAVFSMQGFRIRVSSVATMAAAFDHYYTGHRAPLDTPEATDLHNYIIHL
jgi:MFS transporter, PHS family, inorganic phosphate transporter